MKKSFFFLMSTAIVLTFTACNHENGEEGQTLEVETIRNAVTDYDGNKYDATKIGTQVWMSRNLCTTHYKDGTPIAKGTIGETVTNSDQLNQPRYYQHDFAADPYASNDYYLDNYVRGLYYNWYAANNEHGLCPEGWHLPSVQEWETLLTYVYEHAKNKSRIKALASQDGWPSSSAVGTPGCQPESNNETGFSAVPAGWITFDDHFSGDYPDWTWISSTSQLQDYGYGAYFWTTFRHPYSGGSYYALESRTDYTPGSQGEAYALSVRCVKN